MFVVSGRSCTPINGSKILLAVVVCMLSLSKAHAEINSANTGVLSHPVMPEKLQPGLPLTAAIGIVTAEDWRPEERALSRIVPVHDKQVSHWFGERRIAFTSCKEISGDVAASIGGSGIASCQMNFRKGDHRLQLTTSHRFLGSGSGDTPIVVAVAIEPYNPHLLNNPPGSRISLALGYLEAQGWKPDPHLHEGPTASDQHNNPMTQWYQTKRISNVVCWNETYSGFEAADDPASIDAYGMSKLPPRDVPTCWLSFVKEGQRLVLKATEGKPPPNDANWAGPKILDWIEAGPVPAELIKIQPGMRLSDVMKTLASRFEIERRWVPLGSGTCGDAPLCKLTFVDALEAGQFTNLEIDFLNDPSSGEEPKVVRATVWSGGGP